MKDQFKVLKTLISPEPCYMEIGDFGQALSLAYIEFQKLELDTSHPDRGNWWNCMTAIHSMAQLRFGAMPWNDYLKQNPAIYMVAAYQEVY